MGQHISKQWRAIEMEGTGSAADMVESIQPIIGLVWCVRSFIQNIVKKFPKSAPTHRILLSQ